jgi:hypothetical protein
LPDLTAIIKKRDNPAQRTAGLPLCLSFLHATVLSIRRRSKTEFKFLRKKGNPRGAAICRIVFRAFPGII